MSDTPDVEDDVRQIFCRYKGKRRFYMFDIINTIEACDCEHDSRMDIIESAAAEECPKNTRCHRPFLLVLGLLLLLIFVAIWAGRRYNRARIYGSSGCISSFLWTCDSCVVSF